MWIVNSYLSATSCATCSNTSSCLVSWSKTFSNWKKYSSFLLLINPDARSRGTTKDILGYPPSSSFSMSYNWNKSLVKVHEIMCYTKFSSLPCWKYNVQYNPQSFYYSGLYRALSQILRYKIQKKCILNATDIIFFIYKSGDFHISDWLRVCCKLRLCTLKYQHYQFLIVMSEMGRVDNNNAVR